jgi:hypothetical protein
VIDRLICDYIRLVSSLPRGMIVALIRGLIAGTRYPRRQFNNDGAPERSIYSSLPRLIESDGERGGWLENCRVLTQDRLEGP